MFLYFIREAGHGCIKIGVSKDPAFRLNALRNANPFALEIVGVGYGTRITERSLHRRFDENRLEGEWFRATPELTELISQYPTWEEAQSGSPIPVCDSGHEVLTVMYKNDYTLVEIAKALGVTKQAVEAQARSLGLPRRRERQKKRVKVG